MIFGLTCCNAAVNIKGKNIVNQVLQEKQNELANCVLGVLSLMLHGGRLMV